MRQLTILLSLILCFALVSNVEAQMSKSEAKQWKKKMKSMDPAEFKTIVEEHTELTSEVNSLQGKLSSLQSRISDKDTKIAELTDEIRMLENDLAVAKQASQKPAEDTEVASGRGKKTRLAKGVLFRVQIGAFRNKDLSKYFDNNENFGGEISEDGLQRITLGEFGDYWEADTFKKYLREMGVKDAWIVPYKDGQRVPMKDVLEGVI